MKFLHAKQENIVNQNEHIIIFQHDYTLSNQHIVVIDENYVPGNIPMFG
jgi:hypothetical protein